jgi:RNA polymerase-binding transcription factor
LNTLYQNLQPVISQDHMSDDQLQIIESYLVAEKEQIMKQVRSGVDQIKDGQDKQSDEADAASQFEELSLTLIGRDALLLHLAQVNQSLLRITDEDYGFCDACGIEINIKRLAANPTAKACVDCQTIVEQQGHSYASSAV